MEVGKKEEEFVCMIVRVSNPNKNHVKRERWEKERHVFDIFSPPYLSSLLLSILFSREHEEKKENLRRRGGRG